MKFFAGNIDTQVPLSSRGVNYGDGIFTTIGVSKQLIALQGLHQSRLLDGLQVLGIQAPDWEMFWQFAQQVLAQHQQTTSLEQEKRSVLKILILRGNGGRGYSVNGCSEPEAYFSVNSFPSHYDNWRKQGINVALSDVTLGINPLLAGIKHCNRLEQVLARQKLDADTESDDHLLCDVDGNLIESSAGNLFLLRGQQWLTPRLNRAGVNGVMRQWLLNTYFSSAQVAEVDHIRVEDLSSATSVFICNSLMGIVPVRQFAKQCYDTAPVHELIESVKQYSSNVYF